MADEFGSLGEAFVDIRGRMDKLNRDFKKVESKSLATGKKSGAAIGGGIEKGSKRGSRAMSNLSGSIGKVSQVAGALGLTFGALGVAQIIRNWTSESVKFQQEFANVATLVDTSQVSVRDMKEEVLSLGGTLGSSTDLTRGLYQALSAGQEPANAVKFVGEAAKFAQAALVDTNTSVDVLTTVLNAYGLEAEKATEVSDTLFEVIKQGKTTGEQLSSSLGRVIPTAAALGVGLEEVGAAVATMTKGGLETRVAVTSLNQALFAFLKPSAQAKETAEELGIELSASAIRSDGLLGSLKKMGEAAKGNDEAMTQLFGSVEAMRAILSLTGPQAAEFEKILGGMGDTAGNVNEAFEKQTGTVGKQTQALWANLSNQFITAAGNADAVTESLQGLNQVLEENPRLMEQLVFLFTSFIALPHKARLAVKAFSEEVKDHTIITGDAAAELNRLMKAQEEQTEAFRDAESAIQKTSSKFGPFAEKVAVFRRAYEKGLITQERYNEVLDEYIAKANEASGANEELGDTAGGLTDEQVKLKEAFEDLLRPADSLAEDIQKVLDLGFSKHDIVAVWGDEIKAAADRHRELGETLPDLIEGLDAMARNINLIPFQRTASMADVMNAQVESGGILADIAAGKYDDLNEAIRKNQAANVKAASATKKRAQTQEEFNAELEKYRREQVGATKDAEEFSRIMIDQVSTIFTDFSRGIAETIVEWRGMWDTLKDVAKEAVTALLRIFFEQLFAPLLSGFASLFRGKGFSTGLASAGGLFGGLGSVFAGGGEAAAGAAGGGAAAGGGLGALGGLLSNPITIGAGAAIGGGLLLHKLFTNSPLEAASKEIFRDFGVKASESFVEGFTSQIGLTDQMLEPIRKDITSSPLFFEQVLLPAARASGTVDQLVSRFGNLEAFGKTFDLSAQAARAAEGDFSSLNDAWLEIFGTSEELMRILPDFADVLTVVGDGAEDTAGSMGLLGQGLRGVRDTSKQAASGLKEFRFEARRSSEEVARFQGIVDSVIPGGSLSGSSRQRSPRTLSAPDPRTSPLATGTFTPHGGIEQASQITSNFGSVIGTVGVDIERTNRAWSELNRTVSQGNDAIKEATTAFDEFLEIEQGLSRESELMKLSQFIPQFTGFSQISGIVGQGIGLDPGRASSLVNQALEMFDADTVARAGELLRRGETESFTEALRLAEDINALAGQGIGGSLDNIQLNPSQSGPVSLSLDFTIQALDAANVDTVTREKIIPVIEQAVEEKLTDLGLG